MCNTIGRGFKFYPDASWKFRSGCCEYLFPSLSYCEGDTVVINSITPNGGNSPQYEWYINGQLVSGNSSTYVSTSLSDQDSIRCLLTSSSACAVPAIAWSNDLVLQIHPRVTPEVSLSALSTIICSNEEFSCTPVAFHEGDAPVLPGS